MYVLYITVGKRTLIMEKYIVISKAHFFRKNKDNGSRSGVWTSEIQY